MTNEAPPCVFWRENKRGLPLCRNEILFLQLPPGTLFPSPLLPEVQMYPRFVIKDEIFRKRRREGVRKKRQNNQRIHHFSVTSLAAWTPFLLQSHFVRLQLIFTRRRCYRCQPALITTTRPHRSPSKMIPICFFFF